MGKRMLSVTVALGMMMAVGCAAEPEVQPEPSSQTQDGGQATADVTVEFQEWEVPGGVDAFPHDPAFAPDGSGWYAGFFANVLGRVDPGTGEITEFALPTEESGPHGLVADDMGHIWYTGYRAALIGKLDPKTGDVVEHTMPDPAVSDPHTPVFDDAGVLWFTAQNSNYVGKLDPTTGEVAVAAVATPEAMPHGIAVGPSGIPFFDMSATNKIGSIDPETMAITEYELPEGAKPRRIAITADGIVWYTDLARWISRQVRPGDSSGRGVPVTRRTRVRTVRHRRHLRRRDLVQRVRHPTQHAGTI